MTFITENAGTIIVAVVVAIIFLAIVIKGIKNKKEGKHSCSCGCDGCAASEYCHKTKD
ncbi:MAG: FeoB-associated Cys-rich membrane protein [Clostridia bacterium]|nr:FeoB-associated Cys-rich membrane protein [Clostridia bacterium]